MSDVTQIDLDRALKHLGYDSVADLHYWAKDDGELNRFDALADQLAEHRIAAEKAVLDRLRNLPDDERRPLCERFGFHPQLVDSITTALADALETKR